MALNKYFILTASLFILIVLLIISCKKDKVENEDKDVFGENIYTDSFSPKEWENPASRIKIEAIDKDIGKFISQEAIDPKLRSINKTVSNFIYFIQINNLEGIKNILTQSAFNSFNLRLSKSLKMDNYYSIRIGLPDEKEDQNQFWVSFKLLLKTKSLISKIELTKIEGVYYINDFENKFFSTLNEMFEIKK